MLNGTSKKMTREEFLTIIKYALLCKEGESISFLANNCVTTNAKESTVAVPNSTARLLAEAYSP